jgi:hypothetical protein
MSRSGRKVASRQPVPVSTSATAFPSGETGILSPWPTLVIVVIAPRTHIRSVQLITLERRPEGSNDGTSKSAGSPAGIESLHGPDAPLVRCSSRGIDAGRPDRVPVSTGSLCGTNGICDAFWHRPSWGGWVFALLLVWIVVSLTIAASSNRDPCMTEDR